jgi:phospholipid/cholesterol/gamma-HCH transport system permease protein
VTEHTAAGADAAAAEPAGEAPDPDEARDGPGGLTGWIRALGRFGFSAARHAGRSGILLGATVLALRKPRRYVSETFVQAKQMGVDSLALVLLVGALSGSVLAQQSGYQFTTLPMWIVGQAVAAGMLTELAPVLTAIVLAGRVGAGIGAELGTMRVTDQIDALRTLGRDPVVELIVPRVLAGTFVLVPLVVLANVAGIFSGWVTSVGLLPMTTHEYVFGVQTYYHAAALIFSLVKAVFFGFTITFIASYVGIQAEGGAAGVGRTTTKAVVAVIVAIMVLDVLLAPIYKAVS